jgi:hypothetical protein
MTLAVMLAAVLAQATPFPSPTPTTAQTPIPIPTASKALNSAARTLTFSNALKRLIPDATNEFTQDRGAKFTQRGDQTAYALNFGIVGFTDCMIITSTDSLLACSVYRGHDLATGRTAYATVLAELRTFAGREVPIDEEITNDSPMPRRSATYHPNDEVNVMLAMVEFKGASDVVFYVAPVSFSWSH